MFLFNKGIDMKDISTKEKFIQLRAEGRSFDRIAAELKVSKTTLINWSKELAREINNAQYFAFQSLAEQYQITKQERMTYLMRELKKIYDALSEKEYKDLPIKDLLLIKEKFETALRDEFDRTEYHTGEFTDFRYPDILDRSEVTIKME
jgi:hypothetical protein